jgi:hypothetical protein
MHNLFGGGHFLITNSHTHNSFTTLHPQIVTRGTACNTANCKARMHGHCFANYRRRQNTCPTCTKPWPKEAGPPLLPVGEDAAKDGAGDRRRVRWRSADVEEEEEDGGGDAAAAADEPEEEPQEQPMDEDEPSQATQTQRRSKRRARFQFDED